MARGDQGKDVAGKYMQNPPPTPPRPTYVTRALTWLVDEAIRTRTQLEAIMASEAENAALIGRLQTSLNSVSLAITTQIEQLRDVLDHMAANKPLTAQQLTQLNSIADSLDAETTRLGTDDAPAAPAPTP